MKILLTGYTGLLGRHIAKQLKANGYWLRVLLHSKAITKKELNQEADEHIFGAVDDPIIISKALKDIDCVIHSGWKFNSNYVEHPTINEKATQFLFDESLKSGVQRFVFLSSISVYGMKNEDGILNESSPLASGNELLFIYPREKVIIEEMLTRKKNTSMFLGIFRPGPIFDDYKGPTKKQVGFLGRNYGIGFGNGKNLMPFIHADDVANAILLWIKEGKSNEIFNIVPEKGLRYKDWFRLYGEAKGIKITPFFIRGGILRMMALMVTLLKKVLGKSGKVDVSYTIATSTRNLKYSNEKIKQMLGWNDTYTRNYSETNL